MTTTQVCEESAVIVGVDGSAGSAAALAWAIGHQAVLGPVTPVSSFHVETFGDGLGMASAYVDLLSALQKGAEQRLGEATSAFSPEVGERARVLQGLAGPVLVSAARDASLLVVGSRGRSALVETLLGSVGSYCVKHAAVPVAVVPEPAVAEPGLDTIVVGVDGSDNSIAALEWVRDHVPASGTVLAVGCWSATRGMGAVPVPGLMEEVRDETLDMLDAAVRQVFAPNEKLGAGGPEIRLAAEMGDPRHVLSNLASDADLLVIGARGRVGLQHLLLGSVATSLLHHPTVPTVVVPASSD